jgi:sarcosine oxidase subunit gamma
MESAFVHNLAAITPLGGTVPRIDRFDGLCISENPDWALASITARLGQEGSMAKVAKIFLGAALPEVGHVIASGPFITFWIGPDQWVIEAPFGTHEDLAHHLKSALKDTASVVEQTDGVARFDVEGAYALKFLERLCPLNCRSMDADTVSRTLIEHLSCFVICRTEAIRFSLITPRSSAVSLHHTLCTAAKSVL